VDDLARTDGPPGRHQLLRAVVRALLTSTALLVVYLVAPLDGQFSTATLVGLAAAVVAMGLLVAWQVRAILYARHPALRAVEAIALVLPLFLLLFAGTYVVLSGSDPDAFTEPLDRIDSLYFVVTVFATVGFGDISATSAVARALVTVQMIGDLVLIGLVLRIFLTAVERGRHRAAAQEGAPSSRLG
jgi:voltage-gated potassium channel